MPEQSVTVLLKQIQAGDEDALVALHGRFANLAYSVAYQVLDDAQAAEEVTQDLFMRLWHRAEQFDPARGAFTGWLATITRRLAIDRLRQQHRRGSVGQAVSMDAHPHLWETTLVYEDLTDLQRTLLSALAQLPLEEQQALHLAYFQGMTHSEIAAALGRPLGTVKSHIRQGMDRLRQLWLTDSAAGSDRHRM
jgi:RNA polymerase sigma-70 factor (ECF subfamily)